VFRDCKGGSKKVRALGMKYIVKIRDSVTRRECDVFVSADSDLELLLLLLKPATGVECEIRQLEQDNLGP
jgi:hypothetical protein